MDKKNRNAKNKISLKTVVENKQTNELDQLFCLL